jgi:hypothetical protein
MEYVIWSVEPEEQRVHTAARGLFKFPSALEVWSSDLLAAAL